MVIFPYCRPKLRNQKENNMNEIIEQLEKIVAEYEETLSWKAGGSIVDKTAHVLGQYRKIADNAIYEAKRFLEDVKTQFKALEIVIEGLSSEGMNHSQKRVIANHLITMLRTMIDRIDTTEINYSTQMFDRYNFFRSHTPERKLYEDRANLSMALERNKREIEELKKKHPEIFNESDEDLPY